MSFSSHFKNGSSKWAHKIHFRHISRMVQAFHLPERLVNISSHELHSVGRNLDFSVCLLERPTISWPRSRTHLSKSVISGSFSKLNTTKRDPVTALINYCWRCLNRCSGFWKHDRMQPKVFWGRNLKFQLDGAIQYFQAMSRSLRSRLYRDQCS